MIVRDYTSIGMYQFFKYWDFLLPYIDDARQEIHVAKLECGDDINLKDFSLAINRRLYRLAVDMGFRKKHMKYHALDSPWWVRKEERFADLPVTVLLSL